MAEGDPIAFLTVQQSSQGRPIGPKNTSDFFFDANNGIVLIDRTDGTYQRLYLEGGELKVEQITI